MKQKTFCFYSGLFLFTILFLWIYAPQGIDLHHDGVMLVPALDVASGKVLFRDSFNQYGLLSSVLQALAVRLGGAEILTLRFFTVLFYGGIAILLDLIWKRFLSVPFRVIQLLLFYGLTPSLAVPFHSWSSVYALFFFLLSEELLLCFEERPSQTHLLYWAGVAAGGCFLCRHPVGVAAGAAAGLSLLIGAGFPLLMRRCLVYGSGALTLPAAAAVYLTGSGAWNDFFVQCVRFVGKFAWKRGGGGNWEAFSETLLPLSVPDYWNRLYGVLPLVTLVLLWAVFHKALQPGGDRRQKFTEACPLITVLFFGVTGWHQYYPVPCIRHLYWGGMAMFGAYALCGMRLWHFSRTKKAALLLVVLWGFPVLTALAPRVHSGFLRAVTRNRRIRLNHPGVRGLLLTGSEAQAVDAVPTAFAALPEELRKRGVFNHTPDGIFSVLVPRVDFRHPMFVNWDNEIYPDYQECVRKFIQEKQPVILTTSADYFPGYSGVMEFFWMGHVYRLLVPQE